MESDEGGETGRQRAKSWGDRGARYRWKEVGRTYMGKEP
jgi:hypothetical protein